MIEAHLANDVHEEQLASVLDDYLAAVARGQSPSREELCAAHRHLADDLRTCLASLDVLETLKRIARNGEGSGSTPAAAESKHSATNATAGQTLGGYRMLREIGRGGMGIVYEAEHCKTKERAAVKILPRFHSLDARQLIRFKNESAAAAQLDHPNIVRVLASGCENDCHYFVMQLIDGRSLTQMLAEAARQAGLPSATPCHEDTASFPPTRLHDRWSLDRPCDPVGKGPAIDVTLAGRHTYFRQAARWVWHAALALDHAHGMGVIHRDVKPSNLMVDAENDVWITDFGVARMPEGPTLTGSGDMLGTLRYMSPEQCSGKRLTVDHRTDVYSLGATLYELLTLRPAFPEVDRALLLRQVVSAEPPSPASLQPSLPRDLETVVLRAMAKDREHRYATARELADDLERFLQDRPILARRPSWWERGVRWVRAHSSLVAGVLVATTLSAVALSFTTLSVWRAQANTADALAEARSNLEEANAQRQVARLAIAELEEHSYDTKMRMAFCAWDAADWTLASELLESLQPTYLRSDLRGFDWQLLTHAGEREIRTYRSGGGELYATACSPDGRWLAAAGKDPVIYVWNAGTGALTKTLDCPHREVNSIAVSPSGDRLAAGSDDGFVSVWTLGDGAKRQTLPAHDAMVMTVVFTADGKRLLSGDQSGKVRIWNLDRLDAKPLEIEAGNRFETLAVSPDGKRLATASDEKRLELRDLDHPEAAAVKLVEQRGIALGLAFSADSSTLVSGGQDGAVYVWDVASSKLRWSEAEAHARWVQGMAVAPGGKVAASASKDGSVRLWDLEALENERPLGLLRGHMGRVWSVAFSPDGKTLYSSGADGTVKRWSPSAATMHRSPLEKLGSVSECVVSPLGDKAAACLADGHVVQIDMRTGKVREFGSPHRAGCHAAYSPDGTLLVSGGGDGRVCFWDVRSGELLQADDIGEERSIECLQFSPQGDRLIALAGKDGGGERIVVWDATSRARLPDWPVQTSDRALTCALAPAGDAIAFGSSNGDIEIFNIGSGARLVDMNEHDSRVAALAYSRDGKTLASAQGRTINLWCPGVRVPIGTFAGHEGPVRTVAFDRSGRLLASGGDDGEVKLWSVATQQEVTTLSRLHCGVNSLAFSQDGSFLIAGTEGDGVDSLMFWFASPGPDWRPEMRFDELAGK